MLFIRFMGKLSVEYHVALTLDDLSSYSAHRVGFTHRRSRHALLTIATFLSWLMLLVPSLGHLLLGALNFAGISITLANQGRSLLDQNMSLGPIHAVSSATRSTLDVTGYPTAPADLELEQVHLYVRHGTHASSPHL